MADVRENTTCDENHREGGTRKTSSVASNVSAREDSYPENLNHRPAVSSRESNLSTRTVRFEDEIDFDFAQDSPNFDETRNLTTKFECHRRDLESTI